MNQAIQIRDGARYIEDKQSLKIDALYHGQLIPCFISGANKNALEDIYVSHQFEIEEIFEKLIEEEEFDDNGEIYLSIEQII